jgi:hypothetical protein
MNEANLAAEHERLLRLELMMTDAYDITLGKLHESGLGQTLVAFRRHHKLNADALRDISEADRGAAGQVDGAFTSYLDSVLETLSETTRQDALLGELRIAEAALGMVYGEAIQMEEDADTLGTLKECARNEVEHVGVLAMATKKAFA